MTVLRYLAFATLLWAMGCGGGGSGQPAPSPTSPSSTSWQYTALGDSLAVGILAVTGYVPRYQQYLESDNRVTVSLSDLGQNGWMSSDLLNAIRNDPAMRSAVMNAQVVTFDIGGNDLLHARRLFLEGSCGGSDNQDCLRAAVSGFLTNWDSIVAEILALRSPATTIVRTMDVYNPFVGIDKAAGRFALLDQYLEPINAHIAQSAVRNQIPFAKVHQVFNGTAGDEDPIAKGYISPDGVHPNDNGHKIIADLLRALGYAPLHQ